MDKPTAQCTTIGLCECAIALLLPPVCAVMPSECTFPSGMMHFCPRANRECTFTPSNCPPMDGMEGKGSTFGRTEQNTQTHLFIPKLYFHWIRMSHYNSPLYVAALALSLKCHLHAIKNNFFLCHPHCFQIQSHHHDKTN